MKNSDLIFLAMRNIDLDALQIFKAVADEGGISKAALKLNRVQSNVTTRVKQLETRLDTALFHRRNRRLVLTAEGRILLGYADRLLRLSSEAEATMRGGTPRGTFRLGTLESTAATRLPPVLARYHAAYPDVRLELVTGTTGALITRVLRDDIEAAFVAEPFDAGGLESQPVFEERLVLIAPRSIARARRPRDLGRTTIIAFGAGCTYRRCLESWLTRENVVPERVLELASYHAIVACVAAGAGVALVPRSVLASVAGGNQVRAYPLAAAIARTRTMLVWRAGHRSIALEALRSHLRRPDRARNRNTRPPVPPVLIRPRSHR
jgi:DNA-binding transcriptional LysR family regulator